MPAAAAAWFAAGAAPQIWWTPQGPRGARARPIRRRSARRRAEPRHHQRRQRRRERAGAAERDEQHAPTSRLAPCRRTRLHFSAEQQCEGRRDTTTRSRHADSPGSRRRCHDRMTADANKQNHLRGDSVASVRCTSISLLFGAAVRLTRLARLASMARGCRLCAAAVSRILSVVRWLQQ